jgi:hypothetical protein
MVDGAAKGFTRVLEINGVGYRAEPRGNILFLTLGYSHPIAYQLPAGVTAKVERQVIVTLEGPDREILGEVAAAIRELRRRALQGEGRQVRGGAIRRKAARPPQERPLMRTNVSALARERRRDCPEGGARTGNARGSPSSGATDTSTRRSSSTAQEDRARGLDALCQLRGQLKAADVNAASRSDSARGCLEKGITRIVFDRNGFSTTAACARWPTARAGAG